MKSLEKTQAIIENSNYEFKPYTELTHSGLEIERRIPTIELLESVGHKWCENPGNFIIYTLDNPKIASKHYVYYTNDNRKSTEDIKKEIITDHIEAYEHAKATYDQYVKETGETIDFPTLESILARVQTYEFIAIN